MSGHRGHTVLETLTEVLRTLRRAQKHLDKLVRNASDYEPEVGRCGHLGVSENRGPEYSTPK